MYSYLVSKYANFLSPQLKLFRKVGTDNWNFRCPYCGDSQKNKKKARGYIYFDDAYRYKCFNCEKKCSFEDFLRDQSETLFSDYLKEKLFKPKIQKEDLNPEDFKTNLPVIRDLGPLESLQNVNQYWRGQNAFRQYLVDRRIPERFYSQFYVCPEFKRFTNQIIPDKFSEKSLKFEEARLLIPFFSPDKKMFGYSARSIQEDAFLRYINIIWDDNYPKLFGLDRIDFSKTVYVLEGQFDSLFLDNGLATAGGDLVSAVASFDKTHLVIVYDNEKRSLTTRNKLQKAVDLRYNVCIWPSSVKEKDINQMILSGRTPEEIKETIDAHTYSGLKAQLELARK